MVKLKKFIFTGERIIFLKKRFFYIIFVYLVALFSQSPRLQAACTNWFTWEPDSGTTTWDDSNNWDPDSGIPDANSESALIISDWTIPQFPNRNEALSCVNIDSGQFTAPDTTNRRLAIKGDYFRNLNEGSIIIPSGSVWKIQMSGTSTQSFENVDDIPKLTITNATTVNITESFHITKALTWGNSAGTTNILKKVVVDDTANNVNIKAGVTVVVKDGGEFRVLKNLTVNGTLKIEGGGKLVMGAGKKLLVNASGVIHLAGSTGNTVTLDCVDGGNSFNFDMKGTLNARHFTINRSGIKGINIFDGATIYSMSKGDFHYIKTNGYAVTLPNAGTLTMPALWESIGFFEENASGTQRNINATGYLGGSFTVDDYSGIGGAADETDPNNHITWTNPATAKLQLTNASPTNIPPPTIIKGSTPTYFATFGLSLTAAAGTSTDVTEITFTMDGNNNSSDLQNVTAFKDQDGNCVYDSGVDTTQFGGDHTPSGNPGIFTVLIPTGEITLADTTVKCIHLLVETNLTAQTGNTIGIKIAQTDDVINDQNYSFSTAGGPPLFTNQSTLSGISVAYWHGGNGSTPEGNYAQANNWSPSAVPTTATDCQIGNAYTYPGYPDNTERHCQNMALTINGTMDWNNRPVTHAIYGSITVDSTYTFLGTTAGPGVFSFKGSTNQSVNFNTTWPSDIIVDKPGGILNIESDWIVGDDFTLTTGTVKVTSGIVLRVDGDFTVNGGEFILEPRASLQLGNNSTLTVASGGSLTIVGNTSQDTTITSTSSSNAYAVVINGTISAKYFTFSNYGLNGITINSGATIDSTNHLQNGTFTNPIDNGSTALTLNRQIPGNTLDMQVYSLGGSSVTGSINIESNTTAGTLTMSNYSGDFSGESFDVDSAYAVVWGTPTNTLDLTQEATTPATMAQGSITNMGRFGFTQTNAGSFNDTDITEIILTFEGTADPADVTSVKLYKDTSCTGTGGTLIGGQTFTGLPSKATFSSISGLTVQSHLTTPPKICVYVEYSIDALAEVDATMGVKIDLSTHVTNSEGFAFNGSFSPSVDLGTAGIITGGSTTIWTGGTSTDWNNSGNWTSGIPNCTRNCIIQTSGAGGYNGDPVITGITATCKSMEIQTGTLTMTTGGSSNLELCGSLDNSATITQNDNDIKFIDDGATPTAQTFSSLTPIESITFNKTAGGSVTINSSTLTLNQVLSLGAANNFTLFVPNDKTLVLKKGVAIDGANTKLSLDAGSTTKIENGFGITLSNGTLETTGTDNIPTGTVPIVTSNQAKIANNGTGTWFLTTTAGAVAMTGFVIEDIDTNGVNIGGTTVVSNMDGGIWKNLSNSYASVKALQLNTTGSLPATMNNMQWWWTPDNTTPANTENYLVAASSGCNSQTVNITNFSGDWFEDTATFDTSTKVSNTNCSIILQSAITAITLSNISFTPFDSLVVGHWVTGIESQHLGFNLYRSLNPETGFVQINQNLLRNTLNASLHGSYYFKDTSVENGKTYYYLLEDVDIFGTTTIHGPYFATPLLALGSDSTVYDNDSFIADNDTPGSSSSGTPTVASSNPGVKELAPNVHLLAQTNHYLRVRIDVPAHTFFLSETPPYQRVTIPLYTSSTDHGLPELPMRGLLLKIPEATSAAITEVSRSTTAINGIDLAPAPEWIVDASSNLIPIWSFDTAYYGNNQSNPAQGLDITAQEITQSSGIFYLPLTFHPMSYNPVTQVITKTTSITLDIALDGEVNWNPPGLADIGPWSAEGGVKLGLLKNGFYRVSYDQMEAAGVIGPFDQADTTNFKLFFGEVEIPLEIKSQTGSFNSGDYLNFLGPYAKSLESKYHYLLLVNDIDALSDGARISSIDGDPNSSLKTVHPGFKKTLTFEQNNFALFNEPYGTGLDHILWKRIYAPASSPGDDEFIADVELPNLLNTGNVRVQVMLKGSPGIKAFNVQHHLKISVNGADADQLAFQNNNIYYPHFEIDAGLFVPGRNTLKFTVLGDLVPTGEYDIISFDYIKITYTSDWLASNDNADIFLVDKGSNITLGGLSNNDISLYDITRIGDIRKIVNAEILPDNGVFQATFKTSTEATLGRRFWALTDGQYQTISTYELIAGSDLKNNNNQADVLFIGPKNLLDAAFDLIEYRRQEGFTVLPIELKNIYHEFGHGRSNVDDIQKFIGYTLNSWASPPRYIVLLGDASFDPKGQISSARPHLTPIKLIKGNEWDFGSDHWFTQADQDNLYPHVAIGRIPANNPIEMGDYIEKILDYENGRTAPSQSATSRIVLVADKDQSGGEGFNAKAQALKQLIPSINLNTNTETNDRSTTDDGILKQNIINGFNSGPSIIHYIGHGAENVWASSNVFQNTDAKALTNQKLPLVVAMNCLNSYFYDSDEETKSLGESLLFNKNGGAIAFWGSTSLTNPNAQQPFQNSFYHILLKDPTIRLGEAIRLAKIQGGISAGTAEVIQSWTLLGDPLLKISIAPPPVQSLVSTPKAPTARPSFVNASSGGGGCSASANTGAGHRVQNKGISWQNGLLELLSLYFIYILFRFMRAKKQ